MKTVSLISTSARVSKVFAAAFVLASFLAAAPVHAEDAKPAAAGMGKIAVVDLQFLVANSKAGKSITSQLDTQRNAYQGTIKSKEAALRKEENDLKAQQGKLSKEEFMKKYKAYIEKAQAAELEVRKRRGAFEKAYVGALEKIREHIVKIVADIAGKQQIALVLNRQEVVLVDSKMDITQEVLKALDAKVTTIPVTVK